MTDFTVGTADAFADGTTIGAYPASAWAGSGAIPSGAPLGSAANEQDVADSEVTFTGLTAGTTYYAAEDDAGTRYIKFTVPTTDFDTSSVQSLADDVQVAIDAQGAAVGSEALTRAAADLALDRGRNHAGVIAPDDWGFFGATQALVANRAYFMRFVPTKNRTVTKARFIVTTAAGSNDNVDVGLFSSAFAAIRRTGATAGKLNAAGPQEIALPSSFALVAGTTYFASIACGAIGSTAAQLYSANIGHANGAKMFATTGNELPAQYQDTAHPLPDPVVPAASVAVVPFLAFLE